MYKNIVVGTDGSATAAEAVLHAAALANAFKGSLHIVCACKVPSPVTLATELGVDAEKIPAPMWDPDARAEVESILKVAASAAQDAGVVPKTHAVLADPTEALVAVAGSEGADLIVVGNLGMEGAAGALFGSVPNKLSHAAPCHLLIVHTDS